MGEMNATIPNSATRFMVYESFVSNESAIVYVNSTREADFTDPGYILRYGMVTTIMLRIRKKISLSSFGVYLCIMGSTEQKHNQAGCQQVMDTLCSNQDRCVVFIILHLTFKVLSNVNNFSEEFKDFNILYNIAYGSVFLIGVLGNISVVIVITRTSKMRSLTNRFIANLAVADLLVNILCLPFTLVANLYPAWILGVFFCKTVSYLQGVSVSASVNTLMAISIERCAAISFPLSGTMSNKQYRISVTIIWLVALTINLPWLFVFTLEPIGITGSKAMVCIELWPSQQSENIFFLIANLIICYLGPLVVITICYIIIWRNVANRSVPGERLFGCRKNDAINKSRVKVIKMVFVVIITFALSWLPLYTIFFIVKFYEDVLYYEYFQSAVYLLLPIAQWLGAANSCINPILYAFMNRKFRVGFKNILKKPFFSRRSFENEIRDVNLKQYKTESFCNRRPILRSDSSRMSSHYVNNISLTMRPATERVKL